MSNVIERRCRKAAVLKYYEDGVPIKNIAEEFNIEIDTVRTYIRERKATSKQEEIESKATHKLTIRNWVEGITVLDTLKTPKGKMMVAEIHPHVIRCFNSGGFETFQTAELYYMNK